MFFAYFCIRNYICEGMQDSRKKEIVFANNIRGYDLQRYEEYVLHVLCVKGQLAFTMNNKSFVASSSDYVIFTNVALITNISESDDFEGVVMGFPLSFLIESITNSSNSYSILANLSLLQNPVLNLTAHEFDVCKECMLLINRRLKDVEHVFREDLLGHLLTAHVADLHDIHTHRRKVEGISARKTELLLLFIELLGNRKNVLKNRSLTYYAEKLFVTPHYLSEISREISGEPATFWIDRYSVNEAIRLLRQKELSLTTISSMMNFSSLSHFSKYVQQKIGMTPSEYRKTYERLLDNE